MMDPNKRIEFGVKHVDWDAPLGDEVIERMLLTYGAYTPAGRMLRVIQSVEHKYGSVKAARDAAEAELIALSKPRPPLTFWQHVKYLLTGKLPWRA